jgi:uncharacterized protein
MEQRLSLLTLGVEDLARSAAFYAALGWRGQEVEETVFLQAGGVVLVLWSRERLAADCGLPALPAGPGPIVLAHNVRRREEVAEVVDRARAAGATVTVEPRETFYGGFAGVFLDPDGHAWEVAHNPGFALGPSGEVVLPEALR